MNPSSRPASSAFFRSPSLASAFPGLPAQADTVSPNPASMEPHACALKRAACNKPDGASPPPSLTQLQGRDSGLNPSRWQLSVAGSKTGAASRSATREAGEAGPPLACHRPAGLLGSGALRENLGSSKERRRGTQCSRLAGWPAGDGAFAALHCPLVSGAETALLGRSCPGRAFPPFLAASPSREAVLEALRRVPYRV